MADAETVELVNRDTMPDDREITEVLGLVRGNTVEAKDVATDIVQNIRNTFGGELKRYSELLTKSREKALAEVHEEAAAMEADAVVDLRFDTSTIAEGGIGGARVRNGCQARSVNRRRPR